MSHLYTLSRLLLLLPLLLIASSCVELEQEIVLERNGTGSFQIHASLPSSAYQAWIARPTAPAAQQWASYFDATQGASLFNEAEGLDLKSYRVFEKDQRHYIQIKGAITDAERALSSGLLGKWSYTTTASKTTLTSTPPAVKPPPSSSAVLMELAQGFKLKLTVETPAPPATSTAHHSNGNRSTWTFDATKPPQFLIDPPTFTITY